MGKGGNIFFIPFQSTIVPLGTMYWTLVWNEEAMTVSQRSKEQRSIVRYIHHETKVILNDDLFSVLLADLTVCSYGYLSDSALCLIGITAMNSAEVPHSLGLHTASLCFILFFFFANYCRVILISNGNLHIQKYPQAYTTYNKVNFIQFYLSLPIFFL